MSIARRKPRTPKYPRMPGGGEGITLSFVLPLVPRPKERARTYLRGGRVRTVTPDATREHEAAVALYARAAMAAVGAEPFSVPVLARIEFVLAGTGNAWPVAHRDGDLDNYEKALLDGLNGVAWTDDRLVVGKWSTKVTGSEPCIRVTVLPAPAAGSASPPHSLGAR